MAKIGRPSKGEREVLWSRVARSQSVDIARIAEDHGVAKSDVVAALITVGFAHLDELKLPTKNPDQAELPLKAS